MSAMDGMESGKAVTYSKVWNLPNILTYGRIVAVPLVAGLILWGGNEARGAALLIYVLAAISDFFDGYLARLWKQQSSLGRMLDPIADKVLVSVVLLVLCADDIRPRHQDRQVENRRANGGHRPAHRRACG